MSGQPHVVKVGGSLLSRDNAAEIVGSWLRGAADAQPQSHLVLIVGGGEAVEWIRRLDHRTAIGDTAAHWAAIAMMDINATVVAAWWPDALLTDDWSALQERVQQPGSTLLAPGRFLREIEPSLDGLRLPVGWRVTSDSIAARVAVALDAKLTLLKSTTFAQPASPEEWRALADEEAVDDFFPEIAGEVQVIELATPIESAVVDA